MEGFAAYITKGQAQDKSQVLRPSQINGDENNMTSFSSESLTKNPEEHFKKLRAKIKLKANKRF